MSGTNEHVQAQNRASRRALKKLRDLHEEEYQRIYLEEALAEGVLPRAERNRILASVGGQTSGPE